MISFVAISIIVPLPELLCSGSSHRFLLRTGELLAGLGSEEMGSQIGISVLDWCHYRITHCYVDGQLRVKLLASLAVTSYQHNTYNVSIHELKASPSHGCSIG